MNTLSQKFARFSQVQFVIGIAILFVFFFSARTADAKLSSYQLIVGGVSGYDMSSANSIWRPYTRYYGYWDPTPTDQYSTIYDIGFSFPFNGATYSQLNVYMSGIVTLGTSPIGTSYDNNLGSASMPTIAAFWDEMHPTGPAPSYSCNWDSRVTYMTTGSAPNRVFIVEWYDLDINFGNYYGSKYSWGNKDASNFSSTRMEI